MSESVVLNIGGMTCINCQNRIEEALCRTEGVLNAAVSFKDGTARIDYDDSLIDLKREEVDIYALADAIMRSFETAFRDKRIEPRLLGEETVISADRGRIGEVLANLLSNAVKYTDENGSITVSVKKEKGGALITVEDTGIGIAKEDIGRVFERFYRTDKSRTRKTGGVGIGLSISSAIVKAHGGTIVCESEVGAGSRFIVSLPDGI